jgi:hypothetical protein
MNLNEAIVEDAALEWFRVFGYAVRLETYLNETNNEIH